MEFLIVIGAGLASYIFGAIWYMTFAKTWMDAAGIEADENGRPPNSGAVPYIVALLGAILVAGLMRHMFSLSGIETVWAGLVSGFGVGLFLVTPWIATNYAFAGRGRTLFLIDGGFATIGCTIIGVVLTFV
ncbi:Protein of unknown function [Shimia gijangensis]|uniref:DUF1761 domain-containing protein n=1 Tax=Shimia gijangensis TaxID=1470563 RepID=A0A1M6MUW0_9RHOB|nr:DUF1761 domain-containing protein [Shimia gijangensis]SHJ87212.1 Protein of unknown function [Shimia gijangensis]